MPASRTGHGGFAAIARSRPLAGLLALTVVYLFLYGPVEVAARRIPGSALPQS
jgi:hypothetical protein